MATEERQLKDLVGIGPAMLEDLELLGIETWHNCDDEVRNACTEIFAACADNVSIHVVSTCL